MKSLSQHITEKLVLNNNTKIKKHKDYNYFPKNKRELLKIIKQLVKERGDEADLNDIDTFEIKDMAELFFENKTFNGNISEWDVSNVTDMTMMFAHSIFNGDLSKWNVSNVKDMSGMFFTSRFNGDISKWDVSKVTDMHCMFINSEFTGDISKWNVCKVENMSFMFDSSVFNGDISKWDVSSVEYFNEMFDDCPIKEEYKPKFKRK